MTDSYAGLTEGELLAELSRVELELQTPQQQDERAFLEQRLKILRARRDNPHGEPDSTS